MRDLIRIKTVKTRKPHQCWGCRAKIPVGCLVACRTEADGGKILTTYWCRRCDRVLGEIDLYDDDGVGFGDLIDNYPEKYDTDGEKK